MGYKDLREFLVDAEDWGELKRISGANWDLEMSTIAELVYRNGKRPVPALLFDDIPGCPKGRRTLFGTLTSPRRVAAALCLPLPEAKADPLAVVRSWANKQRNLKLIPPRVIASGPVQENSLIDDKVDITGFPSPKCHELDGGRYIGTCHAVIQQDPDTGWINLGTYRCMVVDRDRIALHIVEGRHGRFIADEKYFNRGKTMPVAVAIGLEPTLLFASASLGVPWGISEYDYAGGIKGEPIEVIKGPYTGLPLPASAEIVIEGECRPGELVDEGPFGEWHGYYANLGLTPVPEPVIRIKNVLYRSDPVLTCSSPAVPPGVNTLSTSINRSATIWGRLDRAGLPGIQGVWCPEEAASSLTTVVSIKQMYAGHSRDVGLVALQLGGITGRHCIVVDDDIDPSNLSQVMWAITTRADPERSIQVIPHCASTSADPIIPAEEKRKAKLAPKPLLASRLLIDACRPYEYKSQWYPIARASPELTERLYSKWASIFNELCVR